LFVPLAVYSVVYEGRQGHRCAFNQAPRANVLTPSAKARRVGAGDDGFLTDERGIFHWEAPLRWLRIMPGTNVRGDVLPGQFDVLIPGGGMGVCNACSNPWGSPDLWAPYR